MSQVYIQLSERLIDLECVLRQQQLWSDTQPSQEALASQQPFCIDTLTFPEWLQYIFLTRMQTMIEQKEPLPSASNIAAMAEEYFRALPSSGKDTIHILRKIDRLMAQ